jgi:predicted TIM-barrel fold metal-dependent hydrolase
MAKRLIAITGDTHLGNRNVKFAPYFDPEYRQAYIDFEDMAKRAAEVMKSRMAEGGLQSLTTGQPDMTMMMAAAAVGGLGNALVDTAGNGSVPYGPELIEENTRIRKELLASLGIEGWDDDDLMTVYGEDDPDLRLKMLEADGQVGQVLFPQIGFLLSSLGPELKWAGIRAYNRWAAEFASAHPDRYAACFMVDLDDIDRACQEAEFGAEHNMRGGSYIGGGRPVGLPAFHNTYYQPYFKLLEELELPFNMHAAFGSEGMDSAGWQDGPGAAVFNQMWIHYNNMVKGGPLVHWISGGVFERHPKLQIVVAETGGCYWGVEVIKALDEVYDSTEMRSSIGKRVISKSMVAKFREMPKRPSEYFRQNVTLQGHNSPLDWQVVDTIPDSVLWSSDYPHPESSWPLSRSEVEENIAEIGPSLENLEKFLGGNAASLYKFDLEKLQPIADEIGPVYDVSA